MNQVIQARLTAIEGEIAELKRKLNPPAQAKSKVTLRGIWKDIHVTDQELAEVKGIWGRTRSEQL